MEDAEIVQPIVGAVTNLAEKVGDMMHNVCTPSTSRGAEANQHADQINMIADIKTEAKESDACEGKSPKKAARMTVAQIRMSVKAKNSLKYECFYYIF